MSAIMLVPLVHTSIATPAQRVLCVIADWAGRYAGTRMQNEIGRRNFGAGYKCVSIDYDNNTRTTLIVRASDRNTVEVQTVISYPERHGAGTTTLRRLCGVADQLGVVLWLNSFPFGRNRIAISIPKLTEFYRRFGFFPVRSIPTQWISDYHRWDGSHFKNLMIRNPVEAIGIE